MIVHLPAECRSSCPSCSTVQNPEIYTDLHIHWFVVTIVSLLLQLHIDRSVDYVFDGSHPPYTPSALTNPLNLYGRTKRDGELAVLDVTGAKTVVLRVPVL